MRVHLQVDGSPALAAESARAVADLGDVADLVTALHRVPALR